MALSSVQVEPVQPTPASAATSSIDSLVLPNPPPLHKDWRQYEKDANLPMPRIIEPPLERQPRYAVECRELSERMRAAGARDEYLSEGIVTCPITAPSSLDGYAIPVLLYSGQPDTVEDVPWVAVYIHGGGLHIGEADSEDLSCRRIVKDAKLSQRGDTRLVLYSVGYRLMPLNPASICVADCADAFRHVRSLHPRARLLLIGSSSGGELAALVAQSVRAGRDSREGNATDNDDNDTDSGLYGVILRCPVTSDAFGGLDPYVPAYLRPLHTSAVNAAFESSLLGPMHRLVPRDGLERMPLEAPAAVLQRLPRHWIQVCTNDMLYSDGVCYAKALETAGVPVQVQVLSGFPHTFWLKTPWMSHALEAEKAMLEGLSWVAGA
ncbi:alpha beta hydrolase domain containing protein [Grosmannia clavigera kw1407]|uniref:Alpha beta hydrolase domain containing protein n=1 Tax=Grosmannia clavigera (strain kw1407 / UAMH 11150) TaxID=655863 RepID=F0XT99_GROCL|nr:alpha beta hydrolase domain containing protein [Grosmannia clavigera kw1407]EFW99354.1 alpha beta hydrolase domain containing protein [Grosmannia clavigera kw1407]